MQHRQKDGSSLRQQLLNDSSNSSEDEEQCHDETPVLWSTVEDVSDENQQEDDSDSDRVGKQNVPVSIIVYPINGHF